MFKTSTLSLAEVLNSNPRSRFVNSQLVCLLLVRISNYVTFIGKLCDLCFSGMPAGKLAKLS